MPLILIANTTLHKARILKTGQLTQYGGMADDGALRRGIAKAYAIYTTGQYAGTTAITLNGKTDNHSNNCVLDKATGLMWTRYASASLGPAFDGKLPWTTAAGEGIFAFADAANLAALAGFTDWRVPNISELLSLEDNEVPNSLPDPIAFPSWPSAYIWSSSTRISGASHGRILNSLFGEASYDAKTATYFTTLVRGG
jgi:hypothetical protein